MVSKVIIGVHGLGNKPPRDILEKWWKNSICEGLRALGHPRPFLKFKLVYWADILHPKPLNPLEKDKKNPYYIEYPYTPAQQIVRKTPSKFRKTILDYLEKELDKIFLNDDLTINFSSITDKIIRHFFKDLHTYYTSLCINETQLKRPVREVIREQLAQTIRRYKRNDILLIGHSMGSIICYDVLTQSVPNIKIDTFVTIGSPLGQPVIMNKVALEQQNKEKKLRTPQNVIRNWYNLSDLEDKVATNYNLGDDYEENANRVRATDIIVYNNYEFQGNRNPHKSYGYLRTLELAQVIHDFLNQGRNRTMIWFTEKVNLWLDRKMNIS